MVFSTAVCSCLIAICGRYPDFCRGVGGNHDVPLEMVFVTFPMTFNKARNGMITAVDKVQAFDGVRLKDEVGGER